MLAESQPSEEPLLGAGWRFRRHDFFCCFFLFQFHRLKFMEPIRDFIEVFGGRFFWRNLFFGLELTQPIGDLALLSLFGDGSRHLFYLFGGLEFAQPIWDLVLLMFKLQRLGFWCDSFL